MKVGIQSSFSFVEPMNALPVEKLPEGDRLYEIKYDCYRALAFKDEWQTILAKLRRARLLAREDPHNSGHWIHTLWFVNTLVHDYGVNVMIAID
jgi:hypothetical protein